MDFHYLSRSKLLVAGLILGQSAFSQTESIKKKDSDETIVVVGNRKGGIKLIDSAAPVDVVFSEELTSTGETDLSSILRNVVPSYNVNTQPISDAATMVRPANMRGLSPDSALVLVNGKRRHRSAVISFLGHGISNGAQGPDISVIPSIALDRVEVLRDSASAQYGSDAIAGVLNFVLKDDNRGGTVQAKFGSFYEGDGEILEYAGNVGFPLFSRGFGNISFEMGRSGSTSRSVQRDDAAAIAESGIEVNDPAQVWGKPETKNNLKVFANFGQPINNHAEIYAMANYATREVEGGFYYRNPDTRKGVFVRSDNSNLRLVADRPNDGINCRTDMALTEPQPTADSGCFLFNHMFPGGFTPRFGGEVKDGGLVAGVRGSFGPEISYDISASRGQSDVDFFIKNTVNASYGPDTPTSFNPGGYTQTEEQVNLDVSIPISVPFLASDLNIALGLENRKEQFEVRGGEEASWKEGPYALNGAGEATGFSVGSNGFSGFSPEMEGVFARSNQAAYIDMEADVLKDWNLGLAGRWEEFEDFGTTQNAKLSTRIRLSSVFAVRSTIGTGFRAPTPGQANISNITTSISGDKLVNQGTIPPTNSVARSLGGKDLEPEKSVSASIGSVFTFKKLRASLDLFRINVRDRIAQTSDIELSEAQKNALGEAGYAGGSGLTNIRFYTNDFDTRTQGADLVISYPVNMFSGLTTFSFSGNYTDTKIISRSPSIIDDTRVRQIEDGLPEVRYHLTGVHNNGPWRSLLRLNYFGGFYEAHVDSGDFPLDVSEEYTLDAEVGYSFSDFSIVIGAQNILDERPDEIPYGKTFGSRYPEASPMGTGGGFYYSKISYYL